MESGPIPDLWNQNMNFTKISRAFTWMFEKLWPHYENLRGLWDPWGLCPFFCGSVACLGHTKWGLPCSTENAGILTLLWAIVTFPEGCVKWYMSRQGLTGCMNFPPEVLELRGPHRPASFCRAPYLQKNPSCAVWGSRRANGGAAYWKWCCGY